MLRDAVETVDRYRTPLFDQPLCKPNGRCPRMPVLFRMIDCC